MVLTFQNFAVWVWKVLSPMHWSLSAWSVFCCTASSARMRQDPGTKAGRCSGPQSPRVHIWIPLLPLVTYVRWRKLPDVLKCQFLHMKWEDDNSNHWLFQGEINKIIHAKHLTQYHLSRFQVIDDYLWKWLKYKESKCKYQLKLDYFTNIKYTLTSTPSHGSPARSLGVCVHVCTHTCSSVPEHTSTSWTQVSSSALSSVLLVHLVALSNLDPHASVCH